jgi:hypothetical protein
MNGVFVYIGKKSIHVGTVLSASREEVLPFSTASWHREEVFFLTVRALLLPGRMGLVVHTPWMVDYLKARFKHKGAGPVRNCSR